MDEIPDFNKLEEQIAESLGHSVETLKDAMPEFTAEHLEAFYTIAFDYYDNGKYREATNFFRFLTTIDHMNKKHWVGLGASLQMLNEYAQAINAYALAALLDEKDPYVPFYAAECCFGMGDTQRGLQALDSADGLAEGDDSFKGLRNKLSALREAWTAPK